MLIKLLKYELPNFPTSQGRLKLLKFSTLAVLLLGFFACSEDVDSSIDDITSDVYEDPNYAEAIVVPSSTGNSLDLSDLHDDIITIQDYAYLTYGIETVCSCDCDGSEANQAYINENAHLIDKYINSEANTFLDWECSLWQSIAGQDCVFQTFSDFWANTDSILTEMPNISLSKKKISLERLSMI